MAMEEDKTHACFYRFGAKWEVRILVYMVVPICIPKQCSQHIYIYRHRLYSIAVWLIAMTFEQ